MKRAIALLSAFSFVIAGSCTHSGRRTNRESERRDGAGERVALRERAEELWNARKKRDCAVMQRFEDLATTVEPEKFITWCQNEDPFKVTDYKIGDALLEDDMGWVSVSSTTVFQKNTQGEPVALDEWEKWRKLDGTWRPVPKNQLKNYPESPALRDAVAEREVRKRFEESWAARMAHDYHRLFEMTDPEDASKIKEEEFESSEKLIEFYDYSILWIEVVGDRGQVRVSYHHKLNDPNLTKMPARTLSITENWIRRNGVWYRDIKRQ